MAKDLGEKWHASRRKLDKLKVKEAELRERYINQLLNGKEGSRSIVFGEERFVASKKQQISMVKADVLGLKKTLPKQVFKSLFGVSYMIKSGVLSSLAEPLKKQVEEKVVSRDVFSILMK